MTPSRIRPLTLAIFGTLLLSLGALLCFFWPVVFLRLLSKELSLSPTSTSFDVWNNSTTIPLHLEIYFFNWTNPEEIRTPGKKPSFVQLGPYTFLERREKVNVVFHPENDTVSFDLKRTWYFDVERSNGTLKDNVTQLNVVALSAVHRIRNWAFYWHTMFELMLIKIGHIHLTKTVDELLFTGYEDTLINMGKISKIVDLPPFDKFGWFYMRNESTTFDGHFNMATGQDSIMNIGILRNWNYRNTTSFYDAPCNAVEGSAGEFWPPDRNFDEITLFSADICRPLTYEYNGMMTYNGIEGKQYVIGDKTLSNSTKRRYTKRQANSQSQDPDVVNVGQCFCNGECTPSGLINVTACRYGAPAFVSLPHFHKADPILREQIAGMNPDDEKHGFHITLEPKTGIPIDVAARLQVNILLQPSDSLSLFSGVPRTYFPMFWFNEHAGITEELAPPLRLLIQLSKFGHYTSIAILVLGSLIVLAAGVLHCLHKRGRVDVVMTMSNKPMSAGFTVPTRQKTELIYLDTTVATDDHDAQTRLNRQLYPKLVGDNLQDL
ncbi:protein croquemort-like isoform X1 [Neodiprion virginianus]|uniref:protein croquemort-like isoform X1 n=1 Tax=Neodiprion virginianus TaxID=2961670 RepID=UPI001EE713C9|nr:protein croquemort-like isoform X1 [Neodiprion virginianus]XP_046611412.1 protein croquemort-like isoform X1 [Neodiprion virginianus]XP_046611413.1 protein croquemort-like isoform X1 [Neodiprion virginianus]